MGHLQIYSLKKLNLLFQPGPIINNDNIFEHWYKTRISLILDINLASYITFIPTTLITKRQC